MEQKAAGIIAVAASLLVFVTLRDWDVGEWRVIAWGIPAFFLVAGGLSMERVLPRLRWLLLVGDASYAIYLTHRFVIGPLMTVSYSLPTPAAVAAVVIGCAAFGIVVHLSIEKPIANLIRRYSDRHFKSAQALLINTSPTLPRAAAPVEIE